MIGIAAAGALGAFAGQAKGVIKPAPQDGLICDYGTKDNTAAAPGNVRVFTLTAKRGRIFTADANQVPMWGYASGTTGAYSYPSPFLCVTAGDDVTVILHNRLGTINGIPVPTSIMFPGQSGVEANGLPVAPGTVQVPPVGGGATSEPARTFVQAATDGATVTYHFVASKPGSYLYTSGTDIALQEQMGLFGGLVVRPAGEAVTAAAGDHRSLFGAGTNSDYQANREFVQMLSDVDPDMHVEVNAGRPFDITTFTPRYWFINGRSMPDTIAPNSAAWMPNQPFSGLVHVLPFDPVKAANETGISANPNGAYDSFKTIYPKKADGSLYVAADFDQYPAAIRYFNASETAHPFHPHAADTTQIGIDGRQLQSTPPVTIPATIPTDLRQNHYLLEVAPGQTQDSTWRWVDTHGWQPGSNPVPVPVQDFRDTRYTGGATWYGGTPYLGVQDDLPDGNTSFNQCGEYYHVAHSHAVNEATTYGAAMGGMLTLYRIDPPGREYCK